MSRARSIKLLKIFSLLAVLVLAGPYTVRAILAQTLYLPIVMRAEATPTPTATPTATPTRTPTQTPPPRAIVNPSFEQGTTGWVFDDDAYVSPVWAYNGIYSAVLGDGEHNDRASIAQQITVPYNQYNLQWFQKTQSNEICSAGTFDKLTIYINGNEFDEYKICSGLNGVDNWIVNLVSYRGETIVFRLEFSSDDTTQSWVYVDDFSFIQ